MPVSTAQRVYTCRSAKILSSQDKYMLSPYGKTNNLTQFVGIELCEDIRFDTVQLATF